MLIANMWYEDAALQGDMEAEYWRSGCTRAAAAADQQTTIQWHMEGAKLVYAEAQFQLGRCYHHGLGVAADMEEALRWYKQSSEGGYFDATAELAILQA